MANAAREWQSGDRFTFPKWKRGRFATFHGWSGQGDAFGRFGTMGRWVEWRGSYFKDNAVLVRSADGK